MLAGQASCLIEREGGCAKPGSGEHGAVQRDAVGDRQRRGHDGAAEPLTGELPGYTVERTLGMSWGLIVRSVGLTKGLTGGLRALKAGEAAEFTEVVDHARRVAMERLVGHAQQLGGNAVLGVRFDSSDIGNGLAEVVAYGTAAIVQPA
jgi:uncharacterized protein YbjQ (UPF0145 family)